MRIMLRTVITMSFFYCLPLSAETNTTIVESCLEHSLAAVLGGGDMEQYLDTTAIVLTVLGRQNAAAQNDRALMDDLASTILTALAERVESRGATYRGARIQVQQSDPRSAIGVITKTNGQRYTFRVLGNFDSNQCHIRQLIIEDVFRLTAWLARQPIVIEKMTSYHLR